jgi:hypothetical protein
VTTQRQAIEPHALQAHVNAGELADADEIQASIAISLKRIADALDASARLSDSAIAVATGNAIAHSINHAIERGLAAPLNQYGEGIGECIAGQFQRSGQ